MFVRCGAILALVLAASPARAQIILHNESANGDLSNVGTAPNNFILAPGINSILGSVTSAAPADTLDFVHLNVPAGLSVTAVINSQYNSADGIAFTGFINAPTFAGSVLAPASYSGYCHFGTNTANPGFPANLVGANLLPVMSDPAVAQGAQGFTPPLGPGDYTFVFRQAGALTQYQFDFTVVPEPAAGLPLLAAGVWRMRRIKN